MQDPTTQQSEDPMTPPRLRQLSWSFSVWQSRDSGLPAVKRVVIGVLLAVVVQIADASAQRGAVAPESGTGYQQKPLATATRHMIAAANPHAAEAGRDILRAGGSAIDAAIAAQLVLGLVEPQSSGLGGGGFLLHHEASSGRLSAYDGRETAPAAARPDRLIEGGRPMSFDRAVHSGLSVGVPGLIHLLFEAHRRHGTLSWADLFVPAIRLADAGFAVSPRLHLMLSAMGPDSFDPASRQYFFTTDDAPRPIGYVLQNPDYAATLRRLSVGGPDAMSSGPIADAIVAAVARAPGAPADLTHADLAGYKIRERAPLCMPYRGYRVCGMGPPSSGGLVVAQTLAMLAARDLRRRSPGDRPGTRVMHLVAEAEKLAFADRDRYVADPDFVSVPPGLLDAAYLDRRGALISEQGAMPRPPPGVPPGLGRQTRGVDTSVESAGTTHLSVIDSDGNAVALTSTIEAAFGSRLWAVGFLLNNELTDFSWFPADHDGRPIANRIEPGKRPRSSMAPTIVYDADGRVFAVLGSPGGARIPLYVIKTLLAITDWRMSAQDAASLQNFGSRGDGFELESGALDIWQVLRLARLGHRIDRDVLTSGVHVLVRRAGRIEGGADPRREGVALGD